MIFLYTICAVIGGTVLICQTLLTVLGLGGDSDFEFDDPTDLESLGSEVQADSHAGTNAGADADGHQGHASSAFFKMLTLRTMIAASTFFGLAGLASDAAGMSPLQSLAIAVVAGMISIYSLHELMRFFGELRSDGTVRLQDAVDCEGQVYLRIPAERHGRGKIHIVLNGQTVELQAETGGDAIPGGATVRVTDYLGSDVVSVLPAVHSRDVEMSPSVVTAR